MWADPQDEFGARLLGFDAIVPAKVQDGTADLGWAKVDSRLDPGQHRLAIPPHSVVVAPDGGLQGRVLTATYRAGNYGLEIAVGDAVLEASSPIRFERNQTVAFDLDAGQLLAITS
jgi:hypothetical protein